MATFGERTVPVNGVVARSPYLSGMANQPSGPDLGIAGPGPFKSLSPAFPGMLSRSPGWGLVTITLTGPLGTLAMAYAPSEPIVPAYVSLSLAIIVTLPDVTGLPL